MYCMFDITAFEDPDDYLDLQFRLLREDFVGTLRTGIQEYKNHSKGKFRSGDVRIYDNVTILRPSFGSDSLTYVLQ